MKNAHGEHTDTGSNILSNTRTSVLSGFTNTEKWVKKNEEQPNFFNRLRSVWLPDEKIFRVFDIASQKILEKTKE